MDLVSGSDKLTLLLISLFDWLEESKAESLYYGNVPFRAAMERYFYFEAVSRPERLRPLLDITQEWRVENRYPEQSAIYDYYVGLQGGLAKQYQNKLLAWLRVLNDFFNHFKSKFQPDLRSKVDNDSEVKVGFFAINERFLHFFSTIEENLEQEQKVYFSPNEKVLKAAFHSQRKGVFATDKSFKILCSNFSISPANKLFPIYFRLCFFHQRISAVLQHWQPDVLLFSEGTSHYDEIASQAATLLGIQTIRVQSGRAGILHSGYVNMSFDHMLCWGPEFVHRYKSVSPKPTYHITGSPIIDEFTQQIEAQNRVRDKKQHVLMVTQPISQYIKKTEYFELIEVAKTILLEREDVQIIVRKHPVDHDDGFEELSSAFAGKVLFMNSPDYSLAEVLSKASCAIGFFSTVISEAAACGVIPITLQNSNTQSVYPYPEKRGVAILSSNKQDTIEKALDVLENREKYKPLEADMNKFSQDFFGPKDGKSLERIISIIKHVTSKRVNI